MNKKIIIKPIHSFGGNHIHLIEGSFKNIKAFKDLNGIDRAIIAELR